METHNAVFLRNILNTTAAMIFWKDAQRRFLGANKAFLDYYGFDSEQDIVGKTDEDMNWHANPNPFMDDELQVLHTGVGTQLVHGKCIRNGEERDILASKEPVYEDGRIVGLVGYFVDVTEQFYCKDEMGQLARDLNGIPAGIAIFQLRFGSMVCISINECLKDLLGARTEQLTGRTLTELLMHLHPDDCERCRQDTAGLYQASRHMDGIYRFRNFHNAQYIWLRCEGRLVRRQNDEEIIYFVYTNVDANKKVEIEEKRLQQMYESSVEAAQLFVWTYDLKAHTIVMGKNPFTQCRCRELGLPQVLKDVPGGLKKFIAKDSWDDFCKMYAELQAGKPYVECNICMNFATSQVPMYLHLSYTNIFDVDGEPVKAYGISRNVTQEMLTYQQYRNSLINIEPTEEDNCIAKGNHDLTANRVLKYVRAWQGAIDLPVGMSYDTALQGFLQTVRYEEDRVRLAALLARENLLALYDKGETNLSFEYYRDGGRHAVAWVHTEAHMLKNPIDGNIECFAASFDSTYQHLNKQIITNLSNMGYHRLGLIDIPSRMTSFYDIDLSSSSIVAASGIIDCNEHIRQNILSQVPAAERQATYELLNFRRIVEEMKRAGTYHCAYNACRTDGALRRMFIQCYYLDKRQQAICVMQSDITDQYQEEQRQLKIMQKALEEMDRANESKMYFLSSMSHDMRTPLNGILGFTHLALQTADSVKKQDYLYKIASSGKIMLALINDVLDLSKIVSGKLVLKPEIFNGCDMLVDVLRVIRQEAEDKGICLDTDFDYDVFGLIEADKLRLQQVLLNLLSNAVKYTQTGGHVLFSLQPLPADKDGYNYQFCIRDDGIGISKEFLPHIFEPFQQEHRMNSTACQGTGLGLAIVKCIVDLMQGDIKVDSQENEGSVFTVRLYIPTVEARFQDDRVTARLSDRAALFIGKKVLICEDNALNAEIAQTILQEYGIESVVAENGSVGVQRFTASGIDEFAAIFMDIRMPVLDGLGATRLIRGMERADASRVPIIAMTADAFRENIEQCLAAGMTGHLSKPVDIKKLEQLLSRLLR